MPFWNVNEGKKTELMSKRAKILLFEGELEEAIGSWSKCVFERRTSTGSDLWKKWDDLSENLDKTNAEECKKSISGDVRRWKTCLFNLPNLSPIFVWSGAAELVVNSVKFPDKGLTVWQ